METVKTELKEALRSKESFEIQVLELEEQVADLQDQTEAALGAEEMVENLTEKNLNLEEKVNQLTETVADLEALHDVNDQLQESAKELEMELRDDLQQSQTIIQNVLLFLYHDSMTNMNECNYTYYFEDCSRAGCHDGNSCGFELYHSQVSRSCSKNDR